MQRIDENTYIDDTLVTCAEYQLFIDEMREQGKYYQPDHWTSNKFPKGYARKPVLGVRRSDAITFCEWLTQREDKHSEWKYRLPFKQEAGNYSMKVFTQNNLGYWLIGDDGQVQFNWIEAIPEGAQGIYLAFDLDLANELSGEFVNYLNRSRPFEHQALIHAIDFAHKRSLTLNLDPTIASDLKSAYQFALFYITNCPKDIGVAISVALNSAYTQVSNLNRGLTIDLDICKYFLTLNERIAGRPPAFEGIRIVKYREQPETLSDIGNSPT